MLSLFPGTCYKCMMRKSLLQVIELLMTCTLYLLVSTSLLCDSLSGAAVPRSVCSLVALMFLLPCLLLTDLRPVSTLSLLCSLAHILIRWWIQRSDSVSLFLFFFFFPHRTAKRNHFKYNNALILSHVIVLRLPLVKLSSPICYTLLLQVIWFISNGKCLEWAKKHKAGSRLQTLWAAGVLRAVWSHSLLLLGN